MGGAPSKKKGGGGKFCQFADRFHTFQELQDGLREAGLESSNLVFGVDFTKSNTWTGKVSFGGKCLHALDPNMQILNPYQQVLMIMARTLEPFDDDHLIPAFGFGDKSTQDRDCFPFFPDGRACFGIQEVQNRYTQLAQTVELSGPTNFGPVIRATIEIAKRDHGYLILLIVADGQVNDEKDTVQAIIEASHYPISICMVGVGDGPWALMEKFDDKIKGRKFDNFQFVPFDRITNMSENAEVDFARSALMEIPDQYMAIKKLGLMNK